MKQEVDMAIKLHGKDFQSWEEFDLNIEGRTAVVGPSNLGKSAIFRSLKGLVRNTLNANQLRVGSMLIQIEATIDGQALNTCSQSPGSCP
jgi:ABC-type phosphate/phosphonate transport system ATPase subunit